MAAASGEKAVAATAVPTAACSRADGSGVASGSDATALDVLLALAAGRPDEPSVWVSPHSLNTAMLMLASSVGDAAAAELLSATAYAITSEAQVGSTLPALAQTARP